MTLVIGSIIVLFEIVIIVWQLLSISQINMKSRQYQSKIDERISYVENEYQHQVREMLDQNRQVLSQISKIINNKKQQSWDNFG